MQNSCWDSIPSSHCSLFFAVFLPRNIKQIILRHHPSKITGKNENVCKNNNLVTRHGPVSLHNGFNAWHGGGWMHYNHMKQLFCIILRECIRIVHFHTIQCLLSFVFHLSEFIVHILNNKFIKLKRYCFQRKIHSLR